MAERERDSNPHTLNIICNLQNLNVEETGKNEGKEGW
jgi:hypothetical protein